MARAGFVVFGFCLGVLSAAGSARASPAEQLGFGPRSQAMAGVGTAVGRGVDTTYANPALLSKEQRNEFTFGWQSTRFDLYADGPNAPGDLNEESLHGTTIGVVLPVPFGGFLEDRVTLGLGVFTPSTLIARARLLYPERAQFPVLTDRAQTLNFAAGGGVDIGYGIRGGAGALALAELVGTVVVRTDSTGRVGTAVDDQLVATYAPVAGVTWDFLPDFTAGLVYRGTLRGDFDVLVQVNDLGSLTVPDLNITGVAQYDPAQLQLEVGHRTGPWTLAVAATYKRWGAFDGWQRPTVRCPASQPDCAALTPEPVEFHDTVVPRIAAAYAFELSPDAKAELRAGYFWEPTPVGEQTGAANYFDNDRHAVGVGYGIELAEPLPPIRLDLVYQHQFLAPRTHEKSAGVPSDNPGYPKVKTGGHVMSTGVALGVKF
ncbi:MAG: outer membrane protein transport protein [Myxococcales bacterium]|nr:outer membrane protein transport protein [Myxococcales bacterium]